MPTNSTLLPTLCRLIGRARAFRIVQVVFLLLGPANQVAQAQTIEALLAEGKVRVNITLAPEQAIVPRQQVVVLVEVMALTAFIGDFTLGYVDVANTVVIPPDNKATLNLRQIDGQAWFTQGRELIIYPIEAGTFTLPALSAQVSLNDEDQSPITGTLYSEPFEFTVAVPPELTQIASFVTASDLSFTLEKSLVKPESDVQAIENQVLENQDQLAVGDAITYTYTLLANDTHSLMLPKFEPSQVNGLQVYQKPSQERNDFDRAKKSTVAIKTETITYIADRKGSFVVPEQRILWWNTQSNTLEQAVIEKQTIVVGEDDGSDVSGVIARVRSQVTQLFVGETKLMPWLYAGVALVFVTALLSLFILQRKALAEAMAEFRQTKRKHLTKLYLRHVENGRYQSAFECLYQLVKLTTGSVADLDSLVDDDSVTVLEQLKQRAFNKPIENESASMISKEQAQQLLDSLLREPSRRTWYQSFEFSLKLNP